MLTTASPARRASSSRRPSIGRRRRGAGQGHADRLGDGAHRVGGEHAAACPFARTRLALDLAELLLRDLAQRASADGFEHAGDVERHAVVLARHDRAVVDEHTGQVETGRGHQHRRDALVAAGQPDEAVEPLGVHDALDRVGDDLAADQRRAHAFVTHADAVADGDGAELHRETARSAHAVLGVLGQLAQRHVARRHVVPRRRDRDLRLHPIVVGHARGPEHRPRRRLGHPVGDVTAARFDVDWCAWFVRGHGAKLPDPDLPDLIDMATTTPLPSWRWLLDNCPCPRCLHPVTP